MSLAHSASEPTLGKTGSGNSKSKLANVGATIGMQVTNLYDQMKSKGLFKEHFHHVPPAGRSIKVPLNDTAEMDLQSEIYYAAPPTPVHERRFRRISHGPGEIHVHHGLKDQHLPGEDFRYGIRGVKGASTEAVMKAGQLMGVAEYKNSVAERIYDSNKREPLGKPHIRGHKLKMLPEGYGNPSGEPSDAKMVIFPVGLKQDSEEHRVQYRKSHNSFLPGERVDRAYNWPAESRDELFRFGKPDATTAEGVGAKMALDMSLEDDGAYKKTKFVQKTNEDYRNVQHSKLERRVHCKQGAKGPPLPHGHRYGIASTTSDYTARSCILGYYPLEEQLPDQDLGCCQKPGRRNVTTETRAFGLPSIRTDVPAPPPGRKSVADIVNYGDEPGCAALLNPQRFDAKGVPDAEFLVRRPKDELREIVNNVAYDMEEDFDDLWDQAVNLFDDGMEMVSLDALLYIHTQQIDTQVSRRLTSVASAPQLRA